jgi:hypothetical protein
MAEWFKAAVLKTVVRKYRGFESYSLRHSHLQWEGNLERAEKVFDSLGWDKETSICTERQIKILYKTERWLSWLKARAC